MTDGIRPQVAKFSTPDECRPIHAAPSGLICKPDSIGAINPY